MSETIYVVMSGDWSHGFHPRAALTDPSRVFEVALSEDDFTVKAYGGGGEPLALGALMLPVPGGPPVKVTRRTYIEAFEANVDRFSDVAPSTS